jgi:hypothetical protein
MALTVEQQEALEFQIAQQKPGFKMDLVRIARDTLVENDRSKPADERGVTAAEITAYADSLFAYISQ